MIQIGEAVKSWCHTKPEKFLKKENIKKDFLKKFGEEMAMRFLRIIWFHEGYFDMETLITPPDDIPVTLFPLLDKLDYGNTFSLKNPSGTRVKISKNAKAQCCYEIAKKEKLAHPKWDLYVGPCMSYGDEGDYHFHAFCITPKGVIIEPTPIVRDYYYGIKIPDVEYLSEF